MYVAEVFLLWLLMQRDVCCVTEVEANREEEGSPSILKEIAALPAWLPSCLVEWLMASWPRLVLVVTTTAP